ncbi:MAG: hypothetical protein AAF596_06150 [Planctomycetota bacterium]
MQAAKRVAKNAKRRIRTASEAVRQHWTRQEADRRREVAEAMQHRLVQALGIQASRATDRR